ncbi:MAG: universal stress protein [Acidimicrobiia bacterium]|nr:universal stress protein [Acidimicrobiia bacterium]
MFDRLLVPLDGTHGATSALGIAEVLADRWDADITVLTVLTKENERLGLDEIVARQVAGVRHAREIDIRPGSYTLADDIATVFEQEDDTLLVMSTMARGRVAGLAANVAEEVMRQVREPMLLVGPSVELPDEWPEGDLMICVDGSDFADTILPVAARWVDALELNPMIVGVIDPSKVPAGVSPAYENNAVARVASGLRDLTDRPVNYDTLHGSDPAEAIVDYARKGNAAMLAMATHIRTGVDRVLHDSVAMAVVRTATCPVLVNRPPVDPTR